MKVGDKVLYNNKYDPPHEVVISRYSFSVIGGREVSDVRSTIQNRNFVSYNENLYEIEPSVDKLKLFKEEFLEIINQDKSAEEIILDLRDHLTN